jgi:hypothetical protein
MKIYIAGIIIPAIHKWILALYSRYKYTRPTIVPKISRNSNIAL